jgi:hypothetical protein
MAAPLQEFRVYPHVLPVGDTSEDMHCFEARSWRECLSLEHFALNVDHSLRTKKGPIC